MWIEIERRQALDRRGLAPRKNSPSAAGGILVIANAREQPRRQVR